MGPGVVRPEFANPQKGRDGVVETTQHEADAPQIAGGLGVSRVKLARRNDPMARSVSPRAMRAAPRAL